MYTDFGGGLNDNLKGQKHKEVSKLRLWGYMRSHRCVGNTFYDALLLLIFYDFVKVVISKNPTTHYLIRS